MDEAVRRIRALDPEAHIFVNTRLNEALEDERRLRAETPRSALHGVPYSLKDEFDTRCLPTTGGSWRYRDRVPDKDSAVYQAFDAAGAVLLGKTNLPDLGTGSEAASYVGGVTTNPFDPQRTCGGSSGGSAAAVANGCVGFEWGADIGGSIRTPAAFCGVLGMRLSHETWPIQELFPRVPTALAWLCGQGPFTKTPDQMRAVLKVAAPRLRTGRTRPFEVRGAVLYLPDRGFWPSFAADVTPHLEAAIGGPVKSDSELAKPSTMFGIYGALLSSHLEDLIESEGELSLLSACSAVLSGVLFGGRFGDRRIHPLTARIFLLTGIGRVTIYRDKAKAMDRANVVRDAFRALWDQGWIVAAPVTPYPPPSIRRSKRQIIRYLNSNLMSCTVPGNIADATAIAIPFGTFEGRLPRAMQLMGPPGSEQELLSLTDRLVASRDDDPTLSQPRIPVRGDEEPQDNSFPSARN